MPLCAVPQSATSLRDYMERLMADGANLLAPVVRGGKVLQQIFCHQSRSHGVDCTFGIMPTMCRTSDTLETDLAYQAVWTSKSLLGMRASAS